MHLGCFGMAGHRRFSQSARSPTMPSDKEAGKHQLRGLHLLFFQHYLVLTQRKTQTSDIAENKIMLTSALTILMAKRAHPTYCPLSFSALRSLSFSFLSRPLTSVLMRFAAFCSCLEPPPRGPHVNSTDSLSEMCSWDSSPSVSVLAAAIPRF